MLDEVGPWKIMWASDWPSQENIISRAQWLEAIKQPKTEVQFAAEEIEIMLGKAAQAVFGIPDWHFSDSKSADVLGQIRLKKVTETSQLYRMKCL